MIKFVRSLLRLLKSTSCESKFYLIAGCCCNSISYALVMLCLKWVCLLLLKGFEDLIAQYSCQQGKGEGTDPGFDASEFLTPVIQTFIWLIRHRQLQGPMKSTLVNAHRFLIKRNYDKEPSNAMILTCQSFFSLPADIQTAVCNNKIKIFDDLYSLFWDTGAW
jgi:hypothetical protein